MISEYYKNIVICLFLFCAFLNFRSDNCTLPFETCGRVDSSQNEGAAESKSASEKEEWGESRMKIGEQRINDSQRAGAVGNGGGEKERQEMKNKKRKAKILERTAKSCARGQIVRICRGGGA